MDVPGLPAKQGLYDPQLEKDACGVGFVAQLKGEKSHDIVRKGLQVLGRLSHRGAQGADAKTGDGAGILLQISHSFFGQVEPLASLGLNEGQYGVGMVFLPRTQGSATQFRTLLEEKLGEEGLSCLGWREVPVDATAIGAQALEAQPQIWQVFVARGKLDGQHFERSLYVARKRAENEIRRSKIESRGEFCIPSLSHRTIVYKGMLLPEQLALFYRDLQSAAMTSAIALVHSRFSTNTFPSWALAHPFRYLSHNGEINTLKGNLNWLRARQGSLTSELFGSKLSSLYPIAHEGQSDSACLDNALEFLVMGGRSLPHAMMMLIPEPWVANDQMDLERRGFYEYHSAMMEPWDGPAAVCFTDGTVIGATLDRNGLRPCRYQVTDDDVVVLASEAGVLPAPAERIREKGRLTPGRMFLVDTSRGRIVEDEEIKAEIIGNRPYRSWVMQDRITLDELPEPLSVPQPDQSKLLTLQQAFGYTTEELKMVIAPMAINGEEPVSSMGTDTPLAVLSDRPQLLFKYFKQIFAQVTNPPIDPIREQLVMSLVTSIGPRPNLLREEPGDSRRIKVQHPILTNAELEKIKRIPDARFKSATLKMRFRASSGPEALREGLVKLCREAATAVRQGTKVLILSDRDISREWAPIPSLLAVSAVHHYLVAKSVRANVAIIVETGEARDVHHFACLIGFGAGSVNPYLALDTVSGLARSGSLPEALDEHTAQGKYLKAIDKGLLKILSKMGISTIQSYCGAQIFEAIGLSEKLVNSYFPGTASRIGGLTLSDLGRETLLRHESAFGEVKSTRLDVGGEIHYRIQGERHGWDPEAIYRLQHATRTNSHATYREFAEFVNNEDRRNLTLRGLFEFEFAKTPVPLEQVEPAAEIVKRFTTGAMSLGAISPEAHETLAVAMNRLGAKSNSGEGGEDAARFATLSNGDSKSSAIKQIASARFGVTAHYLVNARELQIKMAQGAKPGEGGQLPGHKVDDLIARLRHSTPGVQLISPPPHHDIYSIEDLKQLIFDLKNVNPAADVSVKLVSEVGVGTIAAGVAKAHADKILISGDSGGTGASPLSSIKYAGIPWELGLAETHQTLVLNDLRGHVKLETDGQLKTGRDVVIAALLGAEEFGFATAPLIVQGCIMMRKCHLNTCPVGIATQDAELRRRFTGQPEHVINYFFFVAEEARALMAKLGVRTMSELVGRTELLQIRPAVEHWKARGLDLKPLLHRPERAARVATRKISGRRFVVSGVLDEQLIEACAPALQSAKPVSLELPISNVDRAVGTMLSGAIASRYGDKGLPHELIKLMFTGSAGQSFGAFLVQGVSLRLEGEANDYLGKGLSGGQIIVVPPRGLALDSAETVIVGNTLLYGATSGQVFIRGRAGERFAVRNSGAIAVVEGTGDHGCEYMTGGAVVVLGRTGRNFAAGMSGGVAYVLDDRQRFEAHCNLAMVELERELSAEDEEQLVTLLRAHLAHTDSPRAKSLLSDWERARGLFVKVMPTDYKAALEKVRAASLATRNLTEAQVPLV